MKKIERIKGVTFADSSLEKSFRALESGKFEDKQLFGFLKDAISKLKENPLHGTKVPSKLWPKEYINSNGVLKNIESTISESTACQWAGD